MEMTEVWKAWKAMKPAFHPSHTPWKSLRDSHIPSRFGPVVLVQLDLTLRSGARAPIVRQQPRARQPVSRSSTYGAEGRSCADGFWEAQR